MSYEIQKVANGYVVRPAYSITRDRGGIACMDNEVFVFPTVVAMSVWLGEKFGEKAPGPAAAELAVWGLKLSDIEGR
jgi:hypothetical protein